MIYANLASISSKESSEPNSDGRPNVAEVVAVGDGVPSKFFIYVCPTAVHGVLQQRPVRWLIWLTRIATRRGRLFQSCWTIRS